MLRRTYGPPEDRIGKVTAADQIPPDLSLVEVVWIATDLMDPRDFEILDLHVRVGLDAPEIADVVDVDRDAAAQMLERARQRFATAFGATVLWRYAQPVCAALRADLVDADVARFDPETVRVIDRHAAGCEECTARRANPHSRRKRCSARSRSCAGPR